MTTIEQSADPVAPVDSGSRIRGLDALRGVALLGILPANVRQMFLPWELSDFPLSISDKDTLAWFDWHLFHALIDLKFLTLFSLLFGAGFALQGQRLLSRGTGFASVYLRRVLILGLFGMAHAALLYPAEVLLPYQSSSIGNAGRYQPASSGILPCVQRASVIGRHRGRSFPSAHF